MKTKNQIIAELSKLGIPVKDGKVKRGDISSALSVAASANDMHFMTEVSISSLDYEIVDKKVKVEWTLDFDVRQSGVKSFLVGCETNFFDVTVEEEINGEMVEKNIRLDVSDWEINLGSIDLSVGLRPTSVTLQKEGDKITGELDFS
jgi:hypothetical protein